MSAFTCSMREHATHHNIRRDGHLAHCYVSAKVLHNPAERQVARRRERRDDHLPSEVQSLARQFYATRADRPRSCACGPAHFEFRQRRSSQPPAGRCSRGASPVDHHCAQPRTRRRHRDLLIRPRLLPRVPYLRGAPIVFTRAPPADERRRDLVQVRPPLERTQQVARREIHFTGRPPWARPRPRACTRPRARPAARSELRARRQVRVRARPAARDARSTLAVRVENGAARPEVGRARRKVPYQIVRIATLIAETAREGGPWHDGAAHRARAARLRAEAEVRSGARLILPARALARRVDGRAAMRRRDSGTTGVRVRSPGRASSRGSQIVFLRDNELPLHGRPPRSFAVHFEGRLRRLDDGRGRHAGLQDARICEVCNVPLSDGGPHWHCSTVVK
jgi:hypothetical protein